jgi:lipopolysaccharide transport system permease protein
VDYRFRRESSGCVPNLVRPETAEVVVRWALRIDVSQVWALREAFRRQVCPRVVHATLKPVTPPVARIREAAEARLSPPSRLPRPDLRGLAREVDLVYYLAWRDVKVLYKQTLLSGAWVVVQPLAMTAIATLVFHQVAGITPNGIPYPLFALAGYLPWQCFSTGVLAATMTLITNRNMLTKVYFPRIALPVAAVAPALVNFLVGIGVVLVVMAGYGRAPQPQFALIPLGVVLVALTTISVGLITSAVNVRYRDVGQAVPFLLQLGLFLTPLFYSLTSIGEKAQYVYALNPMTGCVEIVRWMLVGISAPSGPVLVSLGSTAVILIFGLLYFGRTEQTFADLV